MLIDIVLYDGVDELDFVGPMEILRAAGSSGADVVVRLCSRIPVPVITCSFGMQVVPDAVFTPGESDVVLVPGGGWAARNDVGTWGEVERGDLLPSLRTAAEKGSTMVSVCTGALLLAHAGIIGDRRCTTHASARQDLAATGATVIDARLVDDGDLITGAGVTSGLDIGLHIVRRYFGDEAAEQASRRAEYWPG